MPVCIFTGTEKRPINQSTHEDNVTRFAGGEGSVKETLFDNAPYNTTQYVNMYFSKEAVFELLDQTPATMRDAAIKSIGFHYALDASNGNLVLMASAGECNGLRLSATDISNRNLMSLPANSGANTNPVKTHLQWVDCDGYFAADKFAKVKAATSLTVKFTKSQLYDLLTSETYPSAKAGWITVKAVIKHPAANEYYLSVDVVMVNPTTNNYAYATDPCPPICY